VVVLANVLGGAMALPQAMRLHRYRDPAGLAPSWAVISAVGNAWWVIYGVGGGSLGVVPVAFFSMTVYLSIIAVLWPLLADSEARVRMAAVGLAIAVLPLPALALGGWAVVGVLLGALYGLQLAPAVVTAYRTTDLSGVSATTWILALVEAALFGIYGLATADAGILVLAACGIAGSGALLLRLGLLRSLMPVGSESGSELPLPVRQALRGDVVAARS
jgi:uncharacterized protein with PQ loop repeat